MQMTSIKQAQCKFSHSGRHLAITECTEFLFLYLGVCNRLYSRKRRRVIVHKHPCPTQNLALTKRDKPDHGSGAVQRGVRFVREPHRSKDQKFRVARCKRSAVVLCGNCRRERMSYLPITASSGTTPASLLDRERDTVGAGSILLLAEGNQRSPRQSDGNMPQCISSLVRSIL
jgi:hypothetical protein